MTDPEIEDLLRRYRPTGPSPDLRARVVTSAAPIGRTWPWVAAAAALLVAVGLMQLSTRDVYEGIQHSVAPSQGWILADLPALANAIEQDPLLKERIEALARQEASDPALRADAGASWQ